MMTALSKTNGVAQAYVPTIPVTKLPPITGATVAATTAAPSTADTAQISEQAKVLSTLFDQANKLVQKKHVEPFTGYVHGNLTTGAVIDVKKYNDYLFGKAADAVVAGAAEQGISLDKGNVIAQLKDANKSVASLNQSQEARNALLGSNFTLTRLTQSDYDKATDTYIAAQENGLSYDPTLISGLKATFSSYSTTGPHMKVVSTEEYLRRYGNDFSPETVARSVREMEDINVPQDTGKDDPRQALLDLPSPQKSTLSSKFGIDQNFLSSLRMLPRSKGTDDIVTFLVSLLKTHETTLTAKDGRQTTSETLSGSYQ
ncbi:MAG: hypothetical protein EOP64_04900 [Sphingomonas sp.]|nr:MAG: hypothetical protein EOP64_04900 [Sphingomonas sp.]